MSKLLKYYSHKLTLKFRFSDFDLIGHLNNAKYQTFLEDGRISYFKEVIGIENDNWQFNSVVSSININFIKPIEYGDNIVLFTRFVNFNLKTHEVHNLFVKNHVENGTGEIVCIAKTIMAGFDYNNKVPKDFPIEYLEKINNFEASSI